ncbi:hypothetical protein NTGBS_530033 [Candidatus Nitrotoga sp. BS]|uniref:transposase n=1 Tax=Candidatus Nitrotoga sp. BS TaxID=2890408 RepID=UPI001EF30964|nr:transposase [Candidatus Nitrotoga sp. BS]CAH1204561.1 hypothetical protein NTGBS_530033 [Candidatus Nitrotoga sp. BS]
MTFKTVTPASEAGDPLERLNAVIDWEMFRSILSRIDPTERKSAAGRKPTYRVLIFKMLILQRLHGLSDERLQYPVSDRLSFMRFLDLDLAGNIPDARTVWAFRKALNETLIRLKCWTSTRSVRLSRRQWQKGGMTTQNSRHWLGEMNKPP